MTRPLTVRTIMSMSASPEGDFGQRLLELTCFDTETLDLVGRRLVGSTTGKDLRKEPLNVLAAPTITRV